MTKAVQAKSGEARKKGEESIAKLETRLQRARREIQALQSSNRRTWENAKEKTHHAFDQLKSRLEEAWDRLS